MPCWPGVSCMGEWDGRLAVRGGQGYEGGVLLYDASGSLVGRCGAAVSSLGGSMRNEEQNEEGPTPCSHLLYLSTDHIFIIFIHSHIQSSPSPIFHSFSFHIVPPISRSVELVAVYFNLYVRVLNANAILCSPWRCRIKQLIFQSQLYQLRGGRNQGTNFCHVKYTFEHDPAGTQ